jgi:hypothetical protein
MLKVWNNTVTTVYLCECVSVCVCMCVCVCVCAQVAEVEAITATFWAEEVTPVLSHCCGPRLTLSLHCYNTGVALLVPSV